jgi:nucleoid DNA-binding protein
MSVTKNDIAIEIARRTGLKQLMVKEVVQLTLDHIVETLVKHGRIELRNFGVFRVRTRKPRKARNPHSGAVVMLDVRKVVCFRAGKIMAEKVSAKPTPVAGKLTAVGSPPVPPQPKS